MKAPEVYLRDTGLLNALPGLGSFNALEGRRRLIDGINEHADAAGLGVYSLRPGQGVDQQQFAEAFR